MRSIWVGRGAAAVAVLLLAGCHIFPHFHHTSKGNTCNDPQPYVRAQSIPPLTVPAGLDPPDTRNALRIPDLKQPEPPPRTRADPCLDSPPPYAVPKAQKPPLA